MVDRVSEAEWHYRQAIALEPNFADAYSNYGNLLKEGDRVEEAILRYRKALEIDPQHANAWSNLGGSYKDTARVDEAIVCYRQALQIRPRFPVAMANLVHCLTTICDWPGRAALLPELIAILREMIERQDYVHAVQPHHALVYPLADDGHLMIAQLFTQGIQKVAQSILLTTGTPPTLKYPRYASRRGGGLDGVWRALVPFQCPGRLLSVRAVGRATPDQAGALQYPAVTGQPPGNRSAGNGRCEVSAPHPVHPITPSRCGCGVLCWPTR